jgi:L-histidine N-alpha-methyltransferase
MDTRTAKSTVDRGEASVAQFAADVRYYLSLTPRQLPSRYLYDDLGSALFESICRLPWYTITRAEMHLLATHGEQVFRRLPALANLVELGPGDGEKLRTLLLAASLRTQTCDVHLVDISPSALTQAAQTIGTVGNIRVITHQATYDSGLREALRQRTGRTLVAFLGSNIGNFDPPGASAFLHNIRAGIQKGDAVLLGVDLVKPTERLLEAYDDPLGVTAAFNRNLLVRINRELGGSIDLDQFSHRAVWNAAQRRVEMHLVAQSAQAIRIDRVHLDLRLEPGEVIWTESSYKYAPEQIDDLLRSCGFRLSAQWIDPDAAFALTMAEAC